MIGIQIKIHLKYFTRKIYVFQKNKIPLNTKYIRLWNLTQAFTITHIQSALFILKNKSLYKKINVEIVI